MFGGVRFMNECKIVENSANILHYIYYSPLMINPKKWRPIKGSRD